ncbi:hypothetical protein [Microlunatus phosphovorus]|uniref:hypothetical protein n=1 Tax=Microlunatus phosphovorus TaxID=29405 RepID=UPI0012EB03F9|nr:hypothetical protein [Microlunatus phosphovorus]
MRSWRGGALREGPVWAMQLYSVAKSTRWRTGWKTSTWKIASRTTRLLYERNTAM